MGLWISRATVLSSAEEFISTIRPKNTNHELVRFGSKHDGGYLIPDDLDGIEACFSAGVGRVVDFERDMANRGIKCFLADYSTDGPPIQNDLFDFRRNTSALGTIPRA